MYDEPWSSHVPICVVKEGSKGEVRDDVEVGPSNASFYFKR